MQNREEIMKINRFLTMASPFILELVRAILQAFGLEVKQEGAGLDIAFSIKSGDKEVKLFMHNLLLEIATQDRDEEPLRFDERLHNFDFFLSKTAQAIESKLRILAHLMSEVDVESAIANICADGKKYERIRIWRFDQEKSC